MHEYWPYLYTEQPGIKAKYCWIPLYENAFTIVVLTIWHADQKISRFSGFLVKLDAEVFGSNDNLYTQKDPLVKSIEFQTQ